MRNIIKIGAMVACTVAIPVYSIDLFYKTSREIEQNFERPMGDIKNSINNTITLFRGIENPVDKIRATGGLLKDISVGVEKMSMLMTYINNKFINSLLSKAVHEKVTHVIKESQNILQLLQRISYEMREYQMNNSQKVNESPVGEGQVPDDFPVVSELDTE